jgi:hypothetical protein
MAICTSSKPFLQPVHITAVFIGFNPGVCPCVAYFAFTSTVRDLTIRLITKRERARVWGLLLLVVVVVVLLLECGMIVVRELLTRNGAEIRRMPHEA